MFYLILICLLVFYCYYIESKVKIKTKITFFISYSPAIFMYWLLPAFQFNVGTDYFTYIDFFRHGVPDYIFNNNEFLFYYLVFFLNIFDFSEQSIFYTISFIQVILVFLILFELSKYKFKIWLLMLLLLIVSSVYHNQMNLLRQFVSVLVVPLLFLYLYKKDYIKLIFVSLVGLGFHKSFLMILLLIPIIWFVSRIKKDMISVLTIVMPFIYLFVFPLVSQFLINFIFPNYGFYTDMQYLNYFTLLTKLYYLPLVFYFIYVYNVNRFYNIFVNELLFKYMLLIFSLTYSVYLTEFTFNLNGRVFKYFQFFYIFPIYYLFDYLIYKNKKLQLLLLFAYIFFPYYIKVFILPTSEYTYDSILFH